MAKASSFSFCWLCWRACYLGFVYIPPHSVSQWFSSWCVETTAVQTVQSQQFVAASFISVSFYSSYLIPSVSAVCSRNLPCVSHLHHQWLLNHKILEVSKTRDHHLRAAVFKKSGGEQAYDFVFSYPKFLQSFSRSSHAVPIVFPILNDPPSYKCKQNSQRTSLWI